ncbi:MAG: helix-turn-helix domain-containing protein [Alcanivoracaceae bacterium]|nr:helix-turn-helix domain-containing protein [Alcanivoracaceae bacterium]
MSCKFRNGIRLERAQMLLRESTLTVQQTAEHAGFDEHNSFTRWFRQLTGFAPSEYRQQF